VGAEKDCQNKTFRAGPTYKEFFATFLGCIAEYTVMVGPNRPQKEQFEEEKTP
jgi:hypothetical protein